jgi:hypothetical protein
MFELTEPSNIQRVYAVVMEFEGTSCATQFPANSVQHALKLWLDDLNLGGIYGLEDYQREGLMQAMEQKHWRMMQLEELQNIWLVTITAADGGVAVLHIVERVLHVGDPG